MFCLLPQGTDDYPLLIDYSGIDYSGTPLSQPLWGAVLNSSSQAPEVLCSPILTRYDMEHVNMLADTLFLLLYTFTLQVFLYGITFFKHTGKR